MTIFCSVCIEERAFTISVNLFHSGSCLECNGYQKTKEVECGVTKFINFNAQYSTKLFPLEITNILIKNVIYTIILSY